jgi:hypothetical protein
MDIFSKFVTSGILFALTLAFGFWLSRLGRPYNGILFNIHKLIALGTVILATVAVFNLTKEVDLQILVIVLFVTVGLCAVSLFASGALMSLEKLGYSITLVVHRIAPILVVIAMGMIFFLLATGK